MNPTTTEPNAEPFAAFVGFDGADQKHAGALCAEGGKPETFSLDQTPEAIEQWATTLRQRFAGRPIAVCLEQSKGALLYALLKYDFFVLFPINPLQSKRFREALVPSGAKDDPQDALLILEILLKHREHLHAWKPDDATTRLIGLLCEDRRQLVAQRTRLTNALKSRLKQYFPQALEVLGELDTELAGQFLLRWDCLEKLQRESPAEIEACYRAQHCNHPKLIADRLALIAKAIPLTTDQAIIDSGRLLVRSLAAQLLALIDPLRQYDQQLAALMEQHADAAIFQSFPGAGDALAPRLLAAFGTDRDRMENATDMQCLSGIAPLVRQSGKTRHVLRRHACNKFLRQTFHEFAQHSLARSAWAKAYYDLLRSRGAKHHAAVRGLAFQWIRILYRCWKQRTLYNETHYLLHLIQRQSPLLKFIAPNP